MHEKRIVERVVEHLDDVPSWFREIGRFGGMFFADVGPQVFTTSATTVTWPFWSSAPPVLEAMMGVHG